MGEGVALFVPCFVDQLYPDVAVAALRVLERLGVSVTVRDGAICCGQPMANAGFVQQAGPVLAQWTRTFADVSQVVVLSGSCAAHVRAHAPAGSPAHRHATAERDAPPSDSRLGTDGNRTTPRVVEFTEFLHDTVGAEALSSLGATYPRRVAIHVGCHALRSLGVARPSELQLPPMSKVESVLSAAKGISFASLERADECCGFGGTFSLSEPAVSTKMGRDRWRDIAGSGAEAVVSTDMSCLMHLRSVYGGQPELPMLHVAEVLAMGLA